MRIKSFSKLNLTLRVLNKLKNGMHNIETYSTLVNIFDEINIKKNIKDKIIFTGKFRSKINEKKNTIKDTLKILRKNKAINSFYRVSIKKNIPVFAGLGGGTSNAVSIAKYLLKNKINKRLIKELEKKIGSDFKLFLHNNSFQKNLNTVLKVKNKLQLPIIILFPYIDCKTKDIYKKVNSFSLSSGNPFVNKVNQDKFIKNIQTDRNDLQKIVEKKYFKISSLIKSIDKQKGCVFSRMTGSGSSCYGVFKSKKTAKIAMNSLKRKYPNYWCVITKTI